MKIKICLSVAGLLLAVGWARAATHVITVQAQGVRSQFVAYAQVEPVANVSIRAVEAGQVMHLTVLPGATVQAGERLAQLGGPEILALLTQDEATVRSARTNRLMAQKSLAIQQQQLLAHLATHVMILQARGAVAQAEAAFNTAQAQLQALRQTLTLTAPATGTILTLNMADGQRVSAGETIVTLLPANRLWLKATYYGADTAAIHPGMTGEFSPASGGKSIPVKAATVFGALAPDGGESVGLLAATPSPNWLNGQFGTVTLYGAVHSLVVVPTRALVVNQGQWWVLVHTAHGIRRQMVTPGPTRGWQTFIKSGLNPGEQVVVENAYLEFHHSIAKTYQPPD